MSGKCPVHVPVSDEAPGFFQVTGQDGGSYPHSNAMLVVTGEEENEGLLLDCGTGNRIMRRLTKEFAISRVYFSHWHEDHALSWPVVNRSTCHCHVDDIAALSSTEELLERYAVKGTSLEAPFTAYMESIGFRPVQDLHPFNGTEHIDLHDGRHVEIIHAPGHTRGHCCFWEPASGVAFLGDIDLTRFGPWYGAADCDLEAFIASLQRLSRLRIAHAVTGHALVHHGAEVQEGLKRYTAIIDARNDRVLQLLSERVPRTEKDLEGKNVVYKHYGAFEPYLYLAETIMIKQHLQLLEKQEKTRKEENGYLLA